MSLNKYKFKSNSNKLIMIDQKKRKWLLVKKIKIRIVIKSNNKI